MRIFIKNIFLFLVITIITLSSSVYFRYGSLQLKRSENNRLFYDKKEIFEDFINSNDSINLILGSSMARDGIIPDSLGNSWFSFTNGGQNIYNSFKLLNFYKNSIKIDTIIIGIQLFDFPFSYTKMDKKRDRLPTQNYNFYVFGSDTIQKSRMKKEIEELKQNNFPDLKRIIDISLSEKINKKEHFVRSKQGFSGRIKHQVRDLDSSYNHELINERAAYRHTNNLKINPNMKYFDLFKNLSDSLNIKVIYLATPKSKYFHLDLKKQGYDYFWHNVIDSLEMRKIKIWDYEKVENDTSLKWWPNLFRDYYHLTYDGAKQFTKIIKKRIRNSS